MNLTSAKLTLAALLMAVSATVVHAEGATPDASKAEPPKEASKAPLADEFVQRVFAAPISLDKTTYACFTRSYDPAHLAEHPQQKVSAMKLLLTAQKYPEDNEMNYTFRLGVKYRNKSATYESAGDCGHGKFVDEHSDEAMLGCGVDCDGGGINVALSNEDKAVIVKLERINVWRAGRDQEPDNAEALVGGVDDKSFRLDRTSLSDCESLANDRKEVAAMRRK